ncbi:VWA domain-containing protein [Oceanimonas baumannii]|uniref:vWA domain-containing protein n=1 Tax=Oceanimonas baumannii TaxID=129578 RepID=UPI001D18D768|nr:VWA domain-containing protein [Oceanimonas baumannii]MCC4264513.1 VWA domain-containing protein [Oceanimonas baumannii]
MKHIQQKARNTICALAVAMACGGVYAQGIDVVFKIDESGSMGDDIADVKDNIVTIFGALPPGSHVGLVGYGSSTVAHFNNAAHVHSSLTTDPVAFEAAVDELIASGGIEDGYGAVLNSANDTLLDGTLNFTGAPYCNILITDETPAQGTSRDDAINAMTAVGGIFFGIMPSDLFSEAQPLADATGGQLFNLGAFRSNAQPVIEAVLAACVAAAVPVKVDIKPTSCPNPLGMTQKGVIPVAILGSEEFDVSRIVPDTVKMAGDCEALHWSYEDVATPYDGGFSEPVLENECTTAGADGWTDLTLKFNSKCVASQLGEVTEREARLINISGQYLNDDDEAVDFEASDVMRLMP